AGGHRGQFSRLERQPQRALAAHADAQQADRPRPQAPALPKEGHHAVQQVALRRDFGVELGTVAVHPPAAAAVRQDADKAQRRVHAGSSASSSRPTVCRNRTPNRGAPPGGSKTSASLPAIVVRAQVPAIAGFPSLVPESPTDRYSDPAPRIPPAARPRGKQKS